MTVGSTRPTVSVIVPVYDDQAGLDATLDSLSRQSYPPQLFEIIVVDNGSRERITVKNPPPAQTTIARCDKPGSYAARNRGVEASRGKILAFIDADCIADPDWLTAGVTAAIRHNRPVGGEVRLFSRALRPNLVERYQLATGFYQKQNIEKQRFSATANLIVLRRIFEVVGTFDEILLSGGDREWGWRAYAAGYPVVFAPNVIIHHPCRTTLQAVARQVRRVAGGRFEIARRKPLSTLSPLLRPHRRPWGAVVTLLDQLGKGIDRYPMLLLGLLLWTTRHAETLRLKLGGKPLR